MGMVSKYVMNITNSLKAENLQSPITDYKKQCKKQDAHVWLALALIFPNMYSFFWHVEIFNPFEPFKHGWGI